MNGESFQIYILVWDTKMCWDLAEKIKKKYIENFWTSYFVQEKLSKEYKILREKNNKLDLLVLFILFKRTIIIIIMVNELSEEAAIILAICSEKKIEKHRI